MRMKATLVAAGHNQTTAEPFARVEAACQFTPGFWLPKTFVRFVRGVPYTAQKGGSKTSGRGVAGRNGRKINIYNILLILFTFHPKLSSVLPTDESRTKRTKDRATDLSSVGRKSLFRTKERTKDQTR